MEKEDKEKIERQCIKEVMEYFKNHTLAKNSEALKIIRKGIEEVFKLEAEEVGFSYDPNVEDEKNDILLKFVNSTNKSEAGVFFPYTKGKYLPRIYINESSDTYKELESENTEIRLNACKTLFRALFHELQHFRQNLITQLNISNKNALMYAKEYYLEMFLDNVFFSGDEKKGNYKVLAIENNADLISWKQLKNLIQEDDDSIELEIANKEDLFYNGVYKVNNIDSKDKKKHFDHDYRIERIDALTEMVDETFDPIFFTIMPILHKEFNSDGTKKSATQLVKNLKSEIMQIMSMDRLDENGKKILITDAKEMYYEIIYKALEKSTKKEITEMQQILGVKESTKILEKMIIYFNKEKEKRKVKRQIRFNVFAKKVKDENELAQFKASYEKVISSLENYYDNKRLFLSNLCEKLNKITRESVAQDTIKANISKSESESEILNELTAFHSLIINENEIEEER